MDRCDRSRVCGGCNPYTVNGNAMAYAGFLSRHSHPARATAASMPTD